MVSDCWHFVCIYKLDSKHLQSFANLSESDCSLSEWVCDRLKTGWTGHCTSCLVRSDLCSDLVIARSNCKCLPNPEKKCLPSFLPPFFVLFKLSPVLFPALSLKVVTLGVHAGITGGDLFFLISVDLKT